MQSMNQPLLENQELWASWIPYKPGAEHNLLKYNTTLKTLILQGVSPKRHNKIITDLRNISSHLRVR